MMKTARGLHFDPELLDIFLENIKELPEIQHRLHSEKMMTAPALSERDRAESFTKEEKKVLWKNNYRVI